MTLEKIEAIVEDIRRDLLAELQADMRSRFSALEDVPGRVRVLEWDREKRNSLLHQIGSWVGLAALIAIGVTVVTLTPAYMQQWKEQVVMEVGQFQPRVFHPNPVIVDRIFRQHVLERYPTPASLERLISGTDADPRNPAIQPDAMFKTVPYE